MTERVSGADQFHHQQQLNNNILVNMRTFLLLFTFMTVTSVSGEEGDIVATCELKNALKGTIEIHGPQDDKSEISVKGKISGDRLTPGKHGFHIHEVFYN